MFKGVFNEDGNAHRLTAIFLPTRSRKHRKWRRFGVSTLLQQQLAQPNTRLLPFRRFADGKISASKHHGTSCPDSNVSPSFEWEDLLGLLRDELQEYGGWLVCSTPNSRAFSAVARTACLRSISPFRRKWRQVKCCRGAAGLRLVPCVLLWGAGRINA